MTPRSGCRSHTALSVRHLAQHTLGHAIYLPTIDVLLLETLEIQSSVSPSQHTVWAFYLGQLGDKAMIVCEESKDRLRNLSNTNLL